MIRLVKVRGQSMAPTLLDGDYVVTHKSRRFTPGHVYIIDHIDLGTIIKRLDHIGYDGLIFSGDNKASTPSSIIAPVAKDRVVGRAFLVISKSGIKCI